MVSTVRGVRRIEHFLLSRRIRLCTRIAPRQNTCIAPHQTNHIAPHQTAHISPHQTTHISPHQTAHIAPYQNMYAYCAASNDWYCAASNYWFCCALARIIELLIPALSPISCYPWEPKRVPSTHRTNHDLDNLDHRSPVHDIHISGQMVRYHFFSYLVYITGSGRVRSIRIITGRVSRFPEYHGSRRVGSYVSSTRKPNRGSDRVTLSRPHPARPARWFWLDP